MARLMSALESPADKKLSCASGSAPLPSIALSNDKAQPVIGQDIELFGAQWPVEVNAPANGAPYPELPPHISVTTPISKYILHLDGQLDHGRRARVYCAKDPDGNHLALKLIHAQTPENCRSIQLEIGQTATMQAYQIPCAGLFEVGKDYLVRDWINGIVGDRWLHAPTWDAASVDELAKFVHHCCAQGVAIGDFKPANLVLTHAGHWIVFDAGEVRDGLSFEDTLQHYRRSFLRKWFRTTPYSPSYLVSKLVAVFSQPH